MKTLNDLYNYAAKKNIKIKKYHFNGDKHWKGHCIYNNSNNCMIFLNDNIKDNVQEKCTLAHEIGHFKKGILQNNILSSEYRDRLLRSINDYRANKWAIDKLIPFEDFKRYLDSNYSKYEVANELEVTEDLLDIAYFIYEPYLKNIN